MTGLAVLARLQAAGAELALRDGAPVLRSPRPLPPELLAEARAHKPELAALLAERERRPSACFPAASAAGTLAGSARASAPASWHGASLLAAERGAAAVAAGLADETDAAEADAIRALAEAPAPNPAEAHGAQVWALVHAALLRPPAWADAAALPAPGARCSCCRGNRWWCEAAAPSGWRCRTCHPPDHLRRGEIREVVT